MMASEKLLLLARDDKMVYLVVAPAAASRSGGTGHFPAHCRAEVPLVRYNGAGGDTNDNEIDTMEDTAFYYAFEELVARLDQPTLRVKVAPVAREAAAHVRTRYVKEGQLGGVDVHLRDSMLISLTRSR